MMNKQYFQKKATVIHQLLQKFAGCSCAIWGAGERGEIFLQMFDLDASKIAYVFDKDKSKYGNKISTGHVVTDFHSTSVDVVIVMNSYYLLEITANLKQMNPPPRIFSVDDIILGDLSLEQILQEQNITPNLAPLKVCKIAAMAILYNPQPWMISCIASYGPFVDKVYLFDNSPSIHEEMFSGLTALFQMEYIYGNGINHGIGYPINHVAERAKKEGMDWLITFDQDSIASASMLAHMREYAESVALDQRVSIIAPLIESPVDSCDYLFMDSAPYSMYMRTVIQSGAMHNVNVLLRVGGYDEKLFIDQVDFDYCIRARTAGHPIIRLNHTVLRHQQNSHETEVITIKHKHCFIGKYSSERYYYQYRNLLYCIDKYGEIDPIYAKGCREALNFLELQVSRDKNYENNMEAIRKAREDFLIGEYGPYKRGFAK